MTTYIPPQLQKEDIRFCLVEKGGKKPFEPGWNDKTNYKYDDPKLLKHIADGGNYGVVAGHRFGNIIVIDFDDIELQEEIFPKLPQTFVVKTAGKGLKHLYYFCDTPNQIKILNEVKRTLCDIQGSTRTGNGSQVVGPSSTLKNGKSYEIIDESPIAFLSQKDLKLIFKEHIIEEDIAQLRKESEEFTKQNLPIDDVVEKIKGKIKLSYLLNKYGLNPKNRIGKGNIECPLHSSQNGQCFSFNDFNGLFYCFHCEWKGDIFTLRMWKEMIDFPNAKERFANELGIRIVPYKKPEVPTKKQKIEDNEIIENIESFYESLPFFYDKSRIFWNWNKDKYKYEMTDEVNLINAIETFLFMKGEIVTTKLYEKYIKGLQSVGRKNLPQDPPLSWIQFKDKIYDISNGNSFNADPKYFHTNPIPHKLGDEENTPEIDRLLKEWVGEDYVNKLYEIMAYSLYREYPIHAIFAFLGSGRNGKSKELELQRRFLGEDNCCSTDLDALMNNRFEALKLYKKLVCFMGETNLTIGKQTSQLKKLSGQDLISYEKKNKDPFDAKNYAKIMIASNGLPQFNDNSDGLAARFHIINFPNQFQEGKDILVRIPEEEYENLGKKCLRILNELLAKGQFDKTGSITTRKKQLDMASNPLPRFIEEWCDTGDEDVFFMKPNELFSAYIKYIQIHKGVTVNKRQFYENLGKEGYEAELARRGEVIDTNYGEKKEIGRFLLGIKLKKSWYEYAKNNGEKQQKMGELMI